MFRRLFLIASFFLLTNYFAQNKDIAKTLQLVSISDGLDRVKALNEASHFYKLNKPDTALLLSQQALSEYKSAYVNLATVFIEQKKYDEAETNLTKALLLSTKLLRNQERLQVYDQFSKLYEQEGAYKEAIYYWSFPKKEIH
ncbi:MAG: tetratricopeptide repeat protein [Bacteroidia bacterium]|nr:tetratricopeptide repeat protein [Bacteroidia bacterium]